MFTVVVILELLYWGLLDFNLFFDLLSRLFAGFDRFLYLGLLLRSNWFLCFFIFKIEFFFGVQIRCINRPFGFGLFLLLFDFFLLLFWLWSLLWLIFLFRWSLLLNLLLAFLILFRNDDFSLFGDLDMVVVQVFESFWLRELADHPASWLLVDCSWYFGRFWLDQRRLLRWDWFSSLFGWLWCLQFFLWLWSLRLRLSVLVVLKYFFVGIDVILEDFGKSFLDKGVVFLDPLRKLKLFFEFICLFGVVKRG